MELFNVYSIVTFFQINVYITIYVGKYQHIVRHFN